MEPLRAFFSSGDFMPHGHCYLWDPRLIWLHVTADALIALAYFSIPLTLFYILRRRRGIPFPWMVLLFGVFIIACGATHLMEIWTLWAPRYWLSGAVKVVTALASLPTAYMLVKIAPRILTLPGVERELAELRSAQETRARLAAIVESSGDAIFSKNLDAVITSWNKGAETIYGYSADEAVGMPVARLLPPDRADEIAGIMERIKAGERLDHYETLRLTKDGRPISVSVTISPLRDAENRVIGASTIARDITERKMAEERFRLVVEAAPNAMIMVGKDGKIVLVNHRAEQLFGYAREELLGQLIEALVPRRFREAHPGHRESFFAAPQARPMGAGRDLFGVRKDGREVPIEIGLNPIESPEGVFTLASIVDITERKRLQDQREIEARNKELETLLHVTSHDLTEPLRAIETFSQIVLDRHAGPLAPEGQDLLRRVARAAARLHSLLDDVSLLTRARKVAAPTKEIEFGAVVREVLERLEVKIQALGAKVQVSGALPRLKVDRTWATQAVYNLINNALKFRAEGKPPEIEIAPYQGSGRVGLAIRDRGPGVPAKHAERIFGLFQRAVPRDVEGTGAGLAIVRAVAERHGGHAWVEPREGGGSEFIITFGPDQPVEAPRL